MTNEIGICNNCQHKEECNMHKKNPWVKVIDCGRFLMNESVENVFNALFKDGEQIGRYREG